MCGVKFFGKGIYSTSFLKYFVTMLIDFIKIKWNLQKLVYLWQRIGLNVHMIGIYRSYALCMPYFPGITSDLPEYLLANSTFSDIYIIFTL